MISCVRWIPKGAAAQNPKLYEINEEEQKMAISAQEEEEEDDEDEDVEVKVEGELKDGLPAELRMDEYSSEEENIGDLLIGKEGEAEEEDMEMDEEEEEADKKSVQSSGSEDNLSDVPDTREYMPLDVEGLKAMKLSGTTIYFDEDEIDEEDDKSDAEDIRIGPDDALIVAAKTDDDFASLEINLYETHTGNLYVHHDILLPSYPLCIEHGGFPSGEGGQHALSHYSNLCAVGTFLPTIEIWNLDVINPLEPLVVLGGYHHPHLPNSTNKTSKKSKHKQHQQQLHPAAHTDAVLSLSFNPIHPNLLASASADSSVKLWDITQPKNAPLTTFSHHTDKAQSVQFHPTLSTTFVTAAYDRTMALIDARTSQEHSHLPVKLSADPEALAFHPTYTHIVTVATEDGTLASYDIRKFRQPLWSFVANDYGGVSDFAYNSQIPDMLATCAIDKTVSIWDLRNIPNHPSSSSTPTITPPTQPPYPCMNKDMAVGKLYTIEFYPHLPYLLGCGGSDNQLALWNLDSESCIMQQFAGRGPASTRIYENDLGMKENGTALEDFQAYKTLGDQIIAAPPHSSKKTKKSRGKKKKKIAYKVKS